MYLYRMDTRPHDEVFINGFATLGNNRNLYLYIEGESCFSGSRDAAFVSTSDSQDFAIEWGRSNRRGSTFYVYRMIPNERFYNATNSLLNAYDQTRNRVYYNTAHRFAHQREWVSYGNISANQIVDVVEYTSNGIDTPPTMVIGYSNPNFYQRVTQPNQGNFTWNFDEDEDSSGSICSSVCSSSSSSFSKYQNTNDVYDWLRCKRKIINYLLME